MLFQGGNSLEHFNETLKKYNKEILPIKENNVGDRIIGLTYRKKMKDEFVRSLVQDLAASLDKDLVEIVINQDGIILMCANEEEGNYSLQLDIKVKNMDYDAYW